MGQPKEATAVAPASVVPSESVPSTPPLSLSALDLAFNDIWANNANAISHCYSSTDALKVDFTRTGKRSFLGMINDATNSVYRMVQGAITDFFRQTCLDFIYGTIGLNGLEKYYDELDSRDPKERVRLVRIRASAIEQCSREVVSEGEKVVGAWTLCSPTDRNVVHSYSLEEKVVLLSTKALHVCSYNYTAESVEKFTRILLGDIEGIKEGLYIINPNQGAHPHDNWGFVVRYRRGESRENTAASIKNRTVQGGKERVCAFRAISNEEEEGENSQKIARAVVDALVAGCTDVGAVQDEVDFVTHETIQSLAEAKAHAGLFGPLLENLKRRLWL